MGIGGWTGRQANLCCPLCQASATLIRRWAKPDAEDKMECSFSIFIAVATVQTMEMQSRFSLVRLVIIAPEDASASATLTVAAVPVVLLRLQAPIRMAPRCLRT